MPDAPMSRNTRIHPLKVVTTGCDTTTRLSNAHRQSKAASEKIASGSAPPSHRNNHHSTSSTPSSSQPRRSTTPSWGSPRNSGGGDVTPRTARSYTPTGFKGDAGKQPLTSPRGIVSPREGLISPRQPGLNTSDTLGKPSPRERPPRPPGQIETTSTTSTSTRGSTASKDGKRQSNKGDTARSGLTRIRSPLSASTRQNATTGGGSSHTERPVSPAVGRNSTQQQLPATSPDGSTTPRSPRAGGNLTPRSPGTSALRSLRVTKGQPSGATGNNRNSSTPSPKNTVPCEPLLPIGPPGLVSSSAPIPNTPNTPHSRATPTTPRESTSSTGNTTPRDRQPRVSGGGTPTRTTTPVRARPGTFGTAAQRPPVTGSNTSAFRNSVRRSQTAGPHTMPRHDSSERYFQYQYRSHSSRLHSLRDQRMGAARKVVEEDPTTLLVDYTREQVKQRRELDGITHSPTDAALSSSPPPPTTAVTQQQDSDKHQFLQAILSDKHTASLSNSFIAPNVDEEVSSIDDAASPSPASLKNEDLSIWTITHSSVNYWRDDNSTSVTESVGHSCGSSTNSASPTNGSSQPFLPIPPNNEAHVPNTYYNSNNRMQMMQQVTATQKTVFTSHSASCRSVTVNHPNVHNTANTNNNANNDTVNTQEKLSKSAVKRSHSCPASSHLCELEWPARPPPEWHSIADLDDRDSMIGGWNTEDEKKRSPILNWVDFKRDSTISSDGVRSPSSTANSPLVGSPQLQQLSPSTSTNSSSSSTRQLAQHQDQKPSAKIPPIIPPLNLSRLQSISPLLATASDAPVTDRPREDDSDTNILVLPTATTHQQPPLSKRNKSHTSTTSKPQPGVLASCVTTVGGESPFKGRCSDGLTEPLSARSTRSCDSTDKLILDQDAELVIADDEGTSTHEIPPSVPVEENPLDSLKRVGSGSSIHSQPQSLQGPLPPPQPPTNVPTIPHVNNPNQHNPKLQPLQNGHPHTPQIHNTMPPQSQEHITQVINNNMTYNSNQQHTHIYHHGGNDNMPPTQTVHSIYHNTTTRHAHGKSSPPKPRCSQPCQPEEGNNEKSILQIQLIRSPDNNNHSPRGPPPPFIPATYHSSPRLTLANIKSENLTPLLDISPTSQKGPCSPLSLSSTSGGSSYRNLPDVEVITGEPSPGTSPSSYTTDPYNNNIFTPHATLPTSISAPAIYNHNNHTTYNPQHQFRSSSAFVPVHNVTRSVSDNVISTRTKDSPHNTTPTYYANHPNAHAHHNNTSPTTVTIQPQAILPSISNTTTGSHTHQNISPLHQRLSHERTSSPSASSCHSHNTSTTNSHNMYTTTQPAHVTATGNDATAASLAYNRLIAYNLSETLQESPYHNTTSDNQHHALIRLRELQQQLTILQKPEVAPGKQEEHNSMLSDVLRQIQDQLSSLAVQIAPTKQPQHQQPLHQQAEVRRVSSAFTATSAMSTAMPTNHHDPRYPSPPSNVTPRTASQTIIHSPKQYSYPTQTKTQQNPTTTTHSTTRPVVAANTTLTNSRLSPPRNQPPLTTTPFPIMTVVGPVDLFKQSLLTNITHLNGSVLFKYTKQGKGKLHRRRFGIYIPTIIPNMFAVNSNNIDDNLLHYVQQGNIPNYSLYWWKQGDHPTVVNPRHAPIGAVERNVPSHIIAKCKHDITDTCFTVSTNSPTPDLYLAAETVTLADMWKSTLQAIVLWKSNNL